MTSDETGFDGEPTHAQQQFIDRLTSDQVAAIDAALVANCASEWRKVARVVGASMLGFNGRFRGLPDVYFAKRIAELVREGRLEAQGNPRSMRSSEVRLLDQLKE